MTEIRAFWWDCFPYRQQKRFITAAADNLKAAEVAEMCGWSRTNELLHSPRAMILYEYLKKYFSSSLSVRQSRKFGPEAEVDNVDML
jgi:hypothetical protein